jgi:hypothetical protein
VGGRQPASGVAPGPRHRKGRCKPSAFAVGRLTEARGRTPARPPTPSNGSEASRRGADRRLDDAGLLA